MPRMKNWKTIARYILAPEDSSGISGRDERADSLLFDSLRPELPLIKGFFWAAIAVIVPLVLPVLLQAVAAVFSL